jgi:multiple sugar transport system permease protein
MSALSETVKMDGNAQVRSRPGGTLGKKRRKLVVDILIYAILILVGITMVFPMFWMISTSFKTEPELFILPPPLLPQHLYLDNYPLAFTRINYLRMIWNSTLVAVLVTAGRVVTSTFAGFAFSRLQFPGRDKLFLIYLAVLMVPFPVTMIPLYLIVKTLGWLNTLWVVIFPPMVSAYNTFLCRQFMLTLPKELEDAARIDGASPPRIYWNVIIPLCGPVIAATIIFSFLSSWNNFLWPLLTLSSPDVLTLPIGMTMIANARINFGGYTPYSQLMAAATAGAIPMIIVFLAAQKQFVQGIAVTGLKG